MKIERKMLWGVKTVVFTLQLRDGREVYMRESLCHHDDGFIVFVDCARFDSVWFKCGDNQFPHLAHGTARQRRGDCKFVESEKGFSLSRESPVRLPFLGARDYHSPAIAVTDGATRITWLLVNGASCFPAYVYNEKSARHVQQSVGIRAMSALSLRELGYRLELQSEWELSAFLD